MKRLPAIDALRGLAVVFMVMHHTVDAWVQEDQRHSLFFMALRQLGGIPAPAFMVLAGLSAALVAAREREKGVSTSTRVWAGTKRGLYILGIAFTFRVAVFISGGNDLAYWPMLFRVDILNCLGVSMALVGAFMALGRNPRQAIAIALGLAALFGLSAPLLEAHKFTFPSELAGNYLMGHGALVLFPLLPWLAYMAAGAALGEYLAAYLKHSTDNGPLALGRAMRPFFIIGAVLFVGALWLGDLPFHLYPPHDYYQSSPLWVTVRVGVQFFLLAAFALALQGDATGNQAAFLQLLGRHSLMAYVSHVELAYGAVSKSLYHALSLPKALGGTTALVLMCAALALGAERWSDWKKARARPNRRSAALPAILGVTEPPAG